MMPTLGAPELIIILVIIVLIFGVGKLPEVGQALGKGIREFRGAADGSVEDETPPAPAAPARPAAPAAPAAVEAPKTAPAPAAPAAVTTPVATPASVNYTVEDGDTPTSVAAKHGVTVEQLLAANGWSKADRVLYEGDKIQVPANNTPVA
ncbi:MAG: twin-arginine translocase TatA/TatE family subunit [Chloroflexi bacterium]|nr:twin-arginine translocase TatA/TatE family subunit [Chloroflexota bacterium]